MKTLRTAPQILEHYVPYRKLESIIDNVVLIFVHSQILKAMRHYNRTKIENLKDKLREEVKDEMYEEARRNLIEQYGLNK